MLWSVPARLPGCVQRHPSRPPLTAPLLLHPVCSYISEAGGAGRRQLLEWLGGDLRRLLLLRDASAACEAGEAPASAAQAAAGASADAEAAGPAAEEADAARVRPGSASDGHTDGGGAATAAPEQEESCLPALPLSTRAPHVAAPPTRARFGAAAAQEPAPRRPARLPCCWL